MKTDINKNNETGSLVSYSLQYSYSDFSLLGSIIFNNALKKLVEIIRTH